MRPRVAGRNAVNAAIVEFFAEQAEGVVLSLSIVWWNLCNDRGMLDKSRETIARRMRKLPEFGLLERVDEDRAYYRMTQKGADHLAGEIEAEELER